MASRHWQWEYRKIPQDTKGRQYKLVDFITKAAPRYGHTDDQISVGFPDSSSPNFSDRLDTYYRHTDGSGFLDHWNGDHPVTGDHKSAVRMNFYLRIRAIAYIAWINGYENLILGPIGCGAFANDPRVVAEVFYNVFVREFRGCFQNIQM